MQTGPLIPGLREYDVRRRHHVAPWVWVGAVLGVLVVLVALAGVLGGVGPLRALGARESPLQPVAWRATADPTVIELAVAIPPEGLCPGDEVRASGVERGPRIEVSATRVQSAAAGSCSGVGIAGDSTWAIVRLDAPLGDRTVVRVDDRQPLPREAPVG